MEAKRADLQREMNQPEDLNKIRDKLPSIRATLRCAVSREWISTDNTITLLLLLLLFWYRSLLISGGAPSDLQTSERGEESGSKDEGRCSGEAPKRAVRVMEYCAEDDW